MDYVNVNTVVLMVLQNVNMGGETGQNRQGIIISYNCMFIYNYLKRNFNWKKKKVMPRPQTTVGGKNNNVEIVL